MKTGLSPRSEVGLSCPRDGSSMNTHRRGVASLHVCGACSGLWITRLQQESWMGLLPPQAPRPERRRALSGQPARAHCPSCKGVQLVIHKVGGVETDVCPQCRGLWLDFGELEAIKEWRRRRHGLHPAPSEAPMAILDVVDSGLTAVEGVGALGEGTAVVAEGAAAVVELLVEAIASLG